MVRRWEKGAIGLWERKGKWIWKMEVGSSTVKLTIRGLRHKQKLKNT